MSDVIDYRTALEIARGETSKLRADLERDYYLVLIHRTSVLTFIGGCIGFLILCFGASWAGARAYIESEAGIQASKEIDKILSSAREQEKEIQNIAARYEPQLRTFDEVRNIATDANNRASQAQDTINNVIEDLKPLKEKQILYWGRISVNGPYLYNNWTALTRSMTQQCSDRGYIAGISDGHEARSGDIFHHGTYCLNSVVIK